MNLPAAIRQSDVAKALKAVIAVGKRPSRVTIAPDGTITIDIDEGPGEPVMSDWRSRSALYNPDVAAAQERETLRRRRKK